MSVFNRCENCSEIAQAICECSFSPRYFCDSHASDHRRSGGTHPFKDAFLSLSSEETSLLREAFDHYMRESYRQAILRRNKKIESLLRQVRKVEEDCSMEMESILKERSAIEEVCVFKGLPLICDSPLLSSLLSLRASSTFSYQEILEQLYCAQSFLPSLSFSLQSPSPRWELSKQFQPHRKSIRSLAVSDCEKYLASGSEDDTIKIWALESLECVNTLVGHNGWVNSVAFWRNRLISGSGDNTIKIWEGDRCLDTLSLHSNRVKSVCVSSCKRLLASGGWDKKVLVYSLEENKRLRSLISHSDTINSVVFSPSDKNIVSGSWDRTIKIWDTDTGEMLMTLSHHSDTVTSVYFVGRFLVSSSVDKSLHIWDLDRETAVRTLNKHSSAVVRVEGNENILVSLAQDNSIIVWDRINGKCIQTLEGHGDYSQDKGWYAMGLKVLRGGAYIISGGKDKNINIFRRLN